MADLNRTALHALHLRLGAKMVPFAGYDMPVQYPGGVLKEHLHTRSAAGLFDVGHMGQVLVTAISGKQADAALALERLVPVDLAGLAEGRQRYGFLTNDAGGIIDDLMIANRGDHFFIVVNASRKAEDLAALRAGLPDYCDVAEVPGRGLIALQGPEAEAALARLVPDAPEFAFMDVGIRLWQGVELWISRSGYTGEDGFEISVPDAFAEALAERLLEMPEVAPIGLGARDSLRLEAGLCLYGHDIDEETTPVEAGLAWAIQKIRRSGGARSGGFPGAERILRELAEGTPRKRRGLRPEGRAPMREGVEIYASDEGGAPIGRVTSGGFGPSIEAPMAMAYLPPDLPEGSTVYGDVRGKRLPARIVPMPFRPATFKR
ncbi:glycine cleavage system aminomethyltransferase GcvT [Frigidibacter albus]|uniref:aminomethyltransferase n=1 Tax=Frigidibacter albus TaxID=1465486 RepID=A0A6L8VFI7_9RHOB|nr:glycine cleavage system aminomethyltransferase GcvT [Frigidibacter albus]MZQ88471.1 glycine cleavage system aminomethyltransferase GcvT [Frigidibacter albus]NBE30720.1 glycine cleavage system aminomethyltransferase GcvT [Frigidibacter albus]GGH48494.1 aminomethyltransferase [Frigidibacter albus]